MTLLDTGDASIGWSPGGCSELFPYISYIYLREGNKTWAKVGSTSGQTHYNVSSVAFLPNSSYDFKVQLRYVINDVNIFSDESEVYNITVPGRFYWVLLLFCVVVIVVTECCFCRFYWVLLLLPSVVIVGFTGFYWVLLLFCVVVVVVTECCCCCYWYCCYWYCCCCCCCCYWVLLLLFVSFTECCCCCFFDVSSVRKSWKFLFMLLLFHIPLCLLILFFYLAHI